MAASVSTDQRTKSTPTAASEPRVNRSALHSKETPEWHDLLSAAANAISPSLFDAQTLKHRAELQSNVKASPENPEAWHAYLRLLNNERKRHATPETAGNMHATLVALFDRATSIIPLIRVNRHSEIYLDIWLDLASLRAEDAEDAYLARETFKYMKRECIGLDFPRFWYAWADLERRLGNNDKADEHTRKGRMRESRGTPSTATKPPSLSSGRRPLRLPRRANGGPNDRQRSDLTAEGTGTENTTDIQTPVTSTTTRRERILASVDRNAPSPALSNWTPGMRESPSPVVKSTPESNLIRPTNSGALESLSKYYAQKRKTPAQERSFEIRGASKGNPLDKESRTLTHQESPYPREADSVLTDNVAAALPTKETPSVRDRFGHNLPETGVSKTSDRDTPSARSHPVRDVYDLLGSTSRKRESNDSVRAPRSASFQEGPRNEGPYSRQRWKYTPTQQQTFAAKPSPQASGHSIPFPKDVASPEMLRSVQPRQEHKPAPSLFSPKEMSALRESNPPSHVVNAIRQQRDTSESNDAVSSDSQRRQTTRDSNARQEHFNLSQRVAKQERKVEWEGERMEQFQYPKGKAGTPGALSRQAQTDRMVARKREFEEPSPRLRASPVRQFSHHSDSSSSATPAMERERHRRRLQSPTLSSFISQLGRDRFITVNDRGYLILGLVGKGGSSKVYKILDNHGRIMALKRVKVQMTSSYMLTLKSYANEIELLKKLQGKPNIVQLYDSEVKSEMGLISLIMEYGEIDLAKHISTADRTTVINKNSRRSYWNQMLDAVHTIHEARIVHGDLKPANFLIVAGSLKLIDFGIAKAIQTDDTTKIVRDTQQGTPNYMSPEALMAEVNECFDEDNSGDLSGGRSQKSQYRVGRASDIWSLGCILYQMVYGRTPFAHIKSVLTKLSCIQDPNHEITYRSVDEPLVVDVLKGCLQRDPAKRMSIPLLLKHPYLNSRRTKAGIDAGTTDLSLQIGGDSRSQFRLVCEVIEALDFGITLPSGERMSVRNGDKDFEWLVETGARKYAFLQKSLAQSDNANSHGRDRSLGTRNPLFTPTTSAITNQASRTGLTGTKTRTGTMNGKRPGTDTNTGERYWN